MGLIRILGAFAAAFYLNNMVLPEMSVLFGHLCSFRCIYTYGGDAGMAGFIGEIVCHDNSNHLFMDGDMCDG